MGQKAHEFLYWEFHEDGFSQAALMQGRWKAIRKKRRDAPLELYDLQADPGETGDVAREHPGRVATLREFLQNARSDSADWPIKEPG